MKSHCRIIVSSLASLRFTEVPVLFKETRYLLSSLEHFCIKFDIYRRRHLTLIINVTSYNKFNIRSHYKKKTNNSYEKHKTTILCQESQYKKSHGLAYITQNRESTITYHFLKRQDRPKRNKVFKSPLAFIICQRYAAPPPFIGAVKLAGCY